MSTVELAIWYQILKIIWCWIIITGVKDIEVVVLGAGMRHTMRLQLRGRVAAYTELLVDTLVALGYPQADPERCPVDIVAH
jgi:hypothetical protein